MHSHSILAFTQVAAIAIASPGPEPLSLRCPVGPSGWWDRFIGFGAAILTMRQQVRSSQRYDW